MNFLKKLNPFKRWKSSEAGKNEDEKYEVFRFKYDSFKELLGSNTELAGILADMEEKLVGHEVFGMSYIRSQSTRAVFHTLRMIKSLNALSGNKYPALFHVLDAINERVKEELGTRKEIPVTEPVLSYSQINKEMVDWVGGKSANLGEVLNGVGLPIPEGFAITTHAFVSFLAHNDLVDEINKKVMEVDPAVSETINMVSEDIQRMIILGTLPPEVENAVRDAHAHLAERLERLRGDSANESSVRISMRSSAIGEDSELSFAGQYLSLLNVMPDNVLQSYKFIVASLYTPRAISYRLNKGIRDEDIAMSVACLEMVDSVASGVMYSHHPFNLLEDNIIVSAVWGLGPYVVDGRITPDTYTVSKSEDLAVLETKIASKPVQLVTNPDGGLMEIPVPLELRNEPCLSQEQIKVLAGYGLELERHYHCPQDVEWALDGNGRILILQTRPLRTVTAGCEDARPQVPILTQYPLLVKDGAVACPGVGSGPVFQVHSEDDLLDFPEGAVLVARHSSPKFVIVMQKAAAIVTDSGSVTGHMASLSREFRIPTVLDAKVATSIQNGTEVTVDGYHGVVYEGRVQELLALQNPRQSHMEDAPVYKALKGVSRWILPLNLVDPGSPNFLPGSCKTLHDIMRLVHEFSYQEMFQISDIFSGKGGWAAKLDAPLPLDLYVIDVGGGLKGGLKNCRRVTPDQVTSTPFKAVLAGMLHDDLRFHAPRPVELKGFLSVMSEQMLTNTYGAERFGDRSYAIASDKYLNFSSRVGYHYSILDTYCGKTVNNNYITFSFKGGAADDVRRNRRVRAIAAILEELGFSIDVKSDKVDARFQKYEAPIIEERLDMIGRLLIFTRQLDMLMSSEESVGAVARSFLEGNYHLDRKTAGGGETG